MNENIETFNDLIKEPNEIKFDFRGCTNFTVINIENLVPPCFEDNWEDYDEEENNEVQTER